MNVHRSEAFRQGMQELGWIEGKNIEYHFAFADGDVSRLDVLARGFIEQKLDVIVNSSGVSTRALQRATKTIPIVMVTVANPVVIGSEVMLLAHAIQESVYGRFGIRLEPVVV